MKLKPIYKLTKPTSNISSKMATSQSSNIPLNPKKEVSYITAAIHESSVKNSPSLNDMMSTSTVPEDHSNTSSNKELSELSTVSSTSRTHIKEIKNDLEFSPYYLKMNTIHEIRNPPEVRCHYHGNILQ